MRPRLGIMVTAIALFLNPVGVDLAFAISPIQGAGATSDERASRVVREFGQQLHFERRDGHVEGSVGYVARGREYSVFLTGTEVVLALNANDRRVRDTELGPSAELRATGPKTLATVLRVKFLGGNPAPHLVGIEILPSRSNYFIGNDPAAWRTNVTHYGKVRVGAVYPGIDLMFYGRGRQLEYDFIVAPRADPDQIRLALEGPEQVTIKENGDLALTLPGGEWTLHAPIAYQDSEAGRERVQARFVIAAIGQVRLALGHYDSARPLVIDPVLSYSTYLGGGGAGYVDKSDWGNGIAVDGLGNTYVAGYASAKDFPTTAGAFDQGGGYAGFVAKFDPSGALVYSSFLGGGGYMTEALAIAVDSEGHAYVTGQTQREDFPTTVGAFQALCAEGTSWGCADAFVTKINPDGASLAYSTYLGGPGSTASGDFGYDWGNGIVIDSEGNAYVAGLTRSYTFPVTAGAFQSTHAGGWADVFVAKLNATGSALVYATYLGGTGGSLHGDEAYAIAVDGEGSAYVTGLTTSLDFPTTAGAFRPANSGYTNGFISKLSADGSSLEYSTYLGGPGSGRIYGGRGIVVDAAGNAYVTGTADNGFPTTPGTFQPQCSTAPALCSDAFVLKLNPAGSELVWSTYLGGSGGEEGRGITLDTRGNVYVAGLTTSANFPLRDAIQGTYAGAGSSTWGDGFVATLSADASRLVFSTYLGGSGDDAGYAIAVDAAGNAYVTGGTSSTDFPTVNPVQAGKSGTFDAFVAKLIAPANVGLYQAGQWRLDRNGNGVWDGCATDRCIEIGMAGDIPLVGSWNGSATGKVGVFRPSDGVFYLDYNGNDVWDGCAVDRCLSIGMDGDIPLVGDWNGDGVAKVAAFRPSDGVFYLDYNGNGQWDGCGVDRCLQIGMLNDVPLVGDWDGTGASKVGTFRPSDGVFYLDYNGNGQWDGCGTDRCLAIGLNGDIPLVGDWDGTGSAKVGAFRPSDGVFYLDHNGNGQWDGCTIDRCLQIGMNGDTPLVGDWTSSGPARVGVYRPNTGTVYLDYNGNGIWDGCETDRCIAMGGSASDTAVLGKW